jgi:hypothetical protein
MSAFAQQLLTRSQAELDALYSTSEAGPIPNGEAKGTMIVAPGTRLCTPLATLIKLLAWQGKVFDAATGTMCNRILPFGLKSVVARVYKAPSWLDQKECIVLDYSRTSLVARKVRDEIRLVAPNCYLGKAYWSRWRLVDFVLEFNADRR